MTITKKIVAGLVVILVLAIAVIVIDPSPAVQVPAGNDGNDETVFCTMEAKLCPDGSYVGRSGPLCEFAECPPADATSTIPTAGDITLGVGQKGSMRCMSITLNSVVQDSRCPADVTCIQAGAINTNVTFAFGTTTKTFNMPSDEAPQAFEGYEISISAINPPRQSTRETAQSEYRITFHAE